MLYFVCLFDSLCDCFWNAHNLNWPILSVSTFKNLDELIERMFNNSVAEGNESRVEPEPNRNDNDDENSSDGPLNASTGQPVDESLVCDQQSNVDSQNDEQSNETTGGDSLEDSLIYVDTYMADGVNIGE